MKITKEYLNMIKELNLTVDEYLVLYSKYHSKDWVIVMQPKNKLYNNLIKLGYLTKTRALSSKGRDIFKQQLEKGNKEHVEEQFALWWEWYPRHDGILHFDRSTRVIRGPREPAYKAWLKAMKRGIDPNVLIQCLINETEGREDASKRTNQNHMTYMKGGARWLNEDEYLNWIDYVTKATPRQYGKDVE